MIRRPPKSPPFPYTPLFRSVRPAAAVRGARPGRARREPPRPRVKGLLLALVVLGLLLIAADRIGVGLAERADRKSTRLNSSHANISYAVFCLKKKTAKEQHM